MERVLAWHIASAPNDAVRHLASLLGADRVTTDIAQLRNLIAQGVSLTVRSGTVAATEAAMVALGHAPEDVLLVEDTRHFFDGTISHDGSFSWGGDADWATFWAVVRGSVDFPALWSAINGPGKRASARLGAIYEVTDLADWRENITDFSTGEF